ncbi:chain-length determining protein [Lentibacter sp. XHP0401]|jgi:protein tyrosine kinase modulator|uniref:chain-length determining protein n=1 Tax=Lentibacter sp. XHP0401 TaxID=2984334 RepID=UPI0021E6E7F8|nr:chain-length determining protein [Lentibacter sp. XHP0401]MCV2893383.1 chain-length determining protein [Lentibacter sp. XHP0401]
MGQIQSLSDFVSMVRRRFWLMSFVVLLGTLGSIYWALGQKKTFEATAVAQIEAPTIADSGARAGATTSIEQRLRLLEQQLMARDNLLAIIKKFGLYSATPMSQSQKVNTLRSSARLMQITDPNAGWGAARTPTGMLITVSDTDPEIAALLANEFLQGLLDLNNRRQSAAASEQLSFFRAEQEQVEADIAALEQRIAIFKELNGPYLPAGIAAQRDELTELRSTLLALDQSLIELEASGTRIRTSVIERQRGLINEQQELIRSRIAEIEEGIARAPEVERQFNLLEREQEQLKAQFTAITQRATSAEMSQALESQNQFERIEVLETALVPENPISGSRKKKVIMGFLASGLLALGLAFILEIMRPVIRTREHLERQLNVKAVVAIPRIETPRTKGRKKLIRVAMIVGLLALIPLLYGVLRDGMGGLTGLLQRRSAS